MAKLTRKQYECFVNPRSIAVVGVSERTGPQAYNLVENLDEEGCTCRVYPVNVRAAEIVGRKAYQSLMEIPEVVDLAVVCTPRETVPDVVRDCVGKGITAVIVVTQGFADADAKGRQLQQELDSIIVGTGTRLLGPNTIGVANLLDRFHTSFQKFDLITNGTAWLCQSGAFVLGAAEFSGGLGIGIDIGNGADVGFSDLLPWLASDPRIGVINLHIEGLREGAEFLAELAEATGRKPVVAFKTGRSEAGARAAISHSGSLACDDSIFEAAFLKAGVLRAETTEEIADLNKALLTFRDMGGDRVGVITISGGTGIAAVDALGAHGLKIAALSPATKSGLTELFPAWFEADNPVDFWPAAMRGGYRETCIAVLDLLLSDSNVDAVLFVIASYRATGLAVIGPVLEAVASRAEARRDKPVAFWIFGANQHEAIAEVERSGVVAGFSSAERAARALAGFRHYVSSVREKAASPLAQPAKIDPGGVRELLLTARRAGTKLLGLETLEVLRAYGLPIAPVRRATRANAAEVARQIGYPLVMKVASPGIVHKSDIGGVRVNIRDEQELLDEYDAMLASVREKAPEARVEGAYLQRHHGGGTEVIIGARRDPQFGAAVLLGLGGVHVEVFRDVAVRLAPLSESDAWSMFGDLRAVRILEGVRGAPAADLGALVQCLLGVSQLMMDFDEISELDINPVAVWGNGAIALDARAVLESGV